MHRAGWQWGGEWARFIQQLHSSQCLPKTCWLFPLFTVLKQRSCFREKLWKSTKPIEHKSHQNIKLQDKVFKGKKKKRFEAPFYLLSSLKSGHIQSLFTTFFLLPGRLGPYLWLFFLKCGYTLLNARPSVREHQNPEVYPTIERLILTSLVQVTLCEYILCMNMATFHSWSTPWFPQFNWSIHSTCCTSSSEQGSDIFHCLLMRNHVTGHRGFE